jgi:hypothetical protein
MDADYHSKGSNSFTMIDHHFIYDQRGNKLETAKLAK